MGRIMSYDGSMSVGEIQEKLTEEQETKSYYESAIPDLENFVDLSVQEPTELIMQETLRNAKVSYNLCKQSVEGLTNLLEKAQNGERVTRGELYRNCTFSSQILREKGRLI